MKEKDLIRSEEVDVNGIFNMIRSFFVTIFSGIAGIVKFSLDNFLKIALFTILGITAGVGVFFFIKPVYSTHIALTSRRMTNDHCALLIQTLEDLNDHDENNVVLAKKLNITPEMALKIKNIEFNNYNDKIQKLYKDSIVIKGPFKVFVKVYDTEILDSLQQGIINYLENNDYALKRKIIDENGLQLLKADINKEITALDSLKKIVSKSIIPQSSGTGIILGQPINPIDVFQKAIDLFNNKLNVQERIALNDNIEVLEGFTKFTKPSWPKLWVTSLIGAITGYLMGVVFSYRFRSKKLNQA